jgi:hypothetical protein
MPSDAPLPFDTKVASVEADAVDQRHASAVERIRFHGIDDIAAAKPARQQAPSRPAGDRQAQGRSQF